MAEQASIIQEGVDRFHAARERVDEELQRIQKELNSRRQRLEKQLESSRKTIEKRTRKQVQQIEKRTRKQVEQIRKNGIVQRAEEAWAEAGSFAENAFERVLDALQIASKGDVDRIDRKLSKINKKLKDIERARTTNGQSPPARV